MTEKRTVLANAPAQLNKADQPWEITVEGDSIIARWKWMDAAFFSIDTVSSQIKDFTFTATLHDDGSWQEMDSENASQGAVSTTGSMRFSKRTFAGKSWQKSTQIGLGKNRQSGESGVIGFQLDTAMLKQPIRDYLTNCGWKKAGGLAALRRSIGTLFGRG